MYCNFLEHEQTTLNALNAFECFQTQTEQIKKIIVNFFYRIIMHKKFGYK